jgi:hypothetical protein
LRSPPLCGARKGVALDPDPACRDLEPEEFMIRHYRKRRQFPGPAPNEPTEAAGIAVLK